MIQYQALVTLLIILTSSWWTGCVDAEGNLVLRESGLGHSTYEKTTVAVGIKDRSEAIAKYLSSTELTAIEGVWVSDDNQYEAAIIRNTTQYYKDYDYLGVVTDTRNSQWSRGQIKMLLKETATPQAYSGVYFDEEHNELGTMFLLSSHNLVEFSAPLGPYGSPHRTMLVRNFPKEIRSSSNVGAENSSGTGFFVTQDMVATNYHVVKEAKQISLIVGGTEVQADLLLKDAQNDLALLRLNSETRSKTGGALKGVKCLAIGSSDGVKSGDAVFTIGFPLSGLLAATPSVAQGLISNTSGIDNDPRMFQISIPIQVGNSGSPLLDSNGRLIGVVTSTLNSRALLKSTGAIPQNVNFAMKSSYLKSILSMAPSSECAESTVLRQSLTARDVQDHYASSVVSIKVSR